MDYRTFYSTGPLDGRFYGEKEEVRVFYPEAAPNGDPFLAVRYHGKGPDTMDVRQDAVLVVQLFEQPEVAWSAQAVRHQSVPMIKYTPLMVLRSIDGEAVPELTPVDARYVQAAQRQAEQRNQVTA